MQITVRNCSKCKWACYVEVPAPPDDKVICEACQKRIKKLN